MKIVEKRSDGTTRVFTQNTEPTRTQQQFKDKVNVNKIMEKYRKTGLIDHVKQNPGVYIDMTRIGSYHEAQNLVRNAENTFNTLPSEVRNRFNHDPQALIDFLSDNKNYDEAAKLGLVIPKSLPPEQPVPKKQKMDIDPDGKVKKVTQADDE